MVLHCLPKEYVQREHLQAIYSRSWNLLQLCNVHTALANIKPFQSSHTLKCNTYFRKTSKASQWNYICASQINQHTWSFLLSMRTQSCSCPRLVLTIPISNKEFPLWTFHKMMTNAAYLWDQFLPERWGVVVVRECHRNNPAFFQSDSCHLPTFSEWKQRQQPASPSLEFKKNTPLVMLHSVISTVSVIPIYFINCVRHNILFVVQLFSPLIKRT